MQTTPKIIATVTNDLNADRRMIRIGEALTEAGYEFVLVGRAKKNSAPLTKKNFTQKRFSLLFERGKFFYFFYNFRIFFWLLTQKFNALYAVDLDSLGACTLAVFFKNFWKKTSFVIFDAHEFFTEVPEVYNRPLIRKMWLTLEKWCVPRADLCFTVSESIASEMFLRYQNEFVVVRNMPRLHSDTSTDMSAANLQKRFEQKILVYLGNLNAGRGVDTAIEALTHLRDFNLWIIGDGELMRPLKETAKKLNVATRVVFYGHQPPEKIPALLAQATWGLNMLEASGKSYEYSLANKFFDYIHAALPILNTDFTEYRNINDVHCVAVLISESSASTLVETLSSTVSDFTRWKILATNCVKAREVLNWEQEEKMLIHAIERLFLVVKN